MALVTCRECGKQVREQDAHCWNCGAGMRPGGQPRKAGGGGPSIAGVVACFVVVAGVVAAISGINYKGPVSSTSQVATAPISATTLALTPLSNPAVDVTLIAGADPDSVSRLLGEPTSRDTNRYRGTDHPRATYRGGGVLVTYIDGKADWIEVTRPAGLSFGPEAIRAFGIKAAPAPSFRNQHIVRWETWEGGNVPGFVGVSMFPLAETGGIDFVTFRVRTPVR
jgi:hypothetical protein